MKVNKSDDVHAIIDRDSQLILPYNTQAEYPVYDPKRAPLVSEFLTKPFSDKLKTRIVIGPVGSSKSARIIQKMLWDCCTLPKCSDGIIRSCMAVVRGTLSRLESTTIVDIDYWTQFLPPPKPNKSPTWQYLYKFNCYDPLLDIVNKVQIKLLFIPLDKIKDIGKLLSLQLTGGYINELPDVPKVVYNAIRTRMNRYPSKDYFKYLFKGKTEEEYKLWFPYQGMVYCDANAPEDDSWLDKLDKKKHELETVEIFRQPPGCIKNENGEWVNNPNADNIASLTPYYYTSMLDDGYEHFKVWALAENGALLQGLPVYPNFKERFHVQDNVWGLIEWNEVFYYGFDFGLTPGFLVAQKLPNGRVIVLDEILTVDGQDCLEQIAENRIIPYINKNFYDKTYECVADPSGATKNENNAMSNIKLLNNLGIKTRKAKTNDPEIRQNAVNTYLNKAINGEPALTIDRRCKTLIKALKSHHCWKKVGIVGKEQYKQVVDKQHPWSEPVDILEYILLEFVSMPKKDGKKRSDLAIRRKT
jgi:hypothetical protein